MIVSPSFSVATPPVAGPYRIVLIQGDHGAPFTSLAQVQDFLNLQARAHGQLITATIQKAVEALQTRVGGQTMTVPGREMYGGWAIFRVDDGEEESDGHRDF